MKKRSLSRALIILKKKGLSTVIATLLLIVVSLIVIAILWVIVSSIISQNVETTKVQSEFFNQHVYFAGVQPDPGDGLKLNVSLKTSGGNVATSTENITVPPSEVDIVSVSDVSGSMRTCLSVVSTSCCTNTLKGYYGSGAEQQNCYGFPDSNMDKCTATPPSGCNGSVLIDALTSSKNANKQLINTVLQKPTDNNRVGLSVYNTSVINSYSSGLTNNNQTLVGIINSWSAYGGTCICCGINDAKNKLSGSSSNIPKALILMSDGVSNQACSQQGTGNATNDSIKAAQDAFAQIPNLTIYSVGLGSDVDSVTMTAIAQGGHGEYFSASQVSDLVGIYQSLADQIIEKSTPISKFNYLKIIFYDSGGNQTINNIDVPGPLETRNYDFNLNGKGLASQVVKMEIYPVSSTKNGKEVIGPLFDSWQKQ